MKKKLFFAASVLSVTALMTTFGLTKAFADGEPPVTDGTFTSSACTYTDSSGHHHVGSECDAPAFQGPCSFATACH